MKFRQPSWSSIVGLSSILGIATAYPNAPGTVCKLALNRDLQPVYSLKALLQRQCNLDLMSTIGHGPSKSTCDDCYKVWISQTSEYDPFVISVKGRQEYQGILLQVKNSENQTVGEFINFSEDEYAPVACEEEGHEDKALDWAGSIGHVDAKLKGWPIELSWTSAREDVYASASNVFRVQGMVVMDYDNYHLIPDYSFTVKKRRQADHAVSPTTSSMTIAITTNALSEATLITEHPPPLAEQDPESGALFLQVLCCIMVLYFVMAIARRIWFKRRAPAADPEALLKEG